MDDRELKHCVTGIEMPREMQARILKTCQAALVTTEKNTRPKKTAGKVIKIAAIAAAVCLLSVTAFAVGIHLFYNPTIVEDRDDAFAQQADQAVDSGSESGVGILSPSSGTPPTLEEVTEAYTHKARGWTSEDTMGGAIRPGYQWVSMEVVEADGPIRSRYVYAESGAVKTEYTAENPADLNAVESDYIHMDLSWLNEQYRYIPNANFFYTIEDKDGEYAGECFEALYAAGDESAWFTLCYGRDPGSSNEDANTYLVKGDYDAVYSYTTADGFEFVIQVYGDCSWAFCATKYSTISFYGGYMSQEEIENILDHLDLYVAENAG